MFSLLMLWHFFVDWTFQSHKMAIAKSQDARVRARHCAEYTLLFFPAWACALNINVFACVAVICILFFTHFFIDSYRPVMWWAKHVRHHPAFDDTRIDDKSAMIAMMSTPVGAILVITMDQIFHLVCLVPIAIILTLH